jgi:pimeloyl-[acyl-carrier protein] methyl ester esterase
MKTIVLLHGWGMNPAVFDALAAGLRHRHTVYTPALPGYGSSPACTPYTLEEIAAAMSSKAPERCHVAGWSLGAHVALHWARAKREQVERLALIAATPCFSRRADWSCAMDGSVLQSFRDALADDAAATLKRFTLLQAQGDSAPRRVAQKLREAIVGEVGSRLPALRGGLDMLANDDLRSVLAEITQPTLLVHGTNDRLVPLLAPGCIARAMPNARLEVVHGAAHAPFVSEPVAVARLLSEHFDG